MTQSDTDRPAFDSWAAYYDVTDADRKPFIGFYGRLMEERTRSLLELGCGTGTILSALADEARRRHGGGVRVVGVDESPEMLRVARNRDADAEWIVGDIRRPPVVGTFDLVISCFNTLQFLLSDDDLASAFSAARQLLSRDGTFAFDIYRPNVPYISKPQQNRLARRIVDGMGRALEVREDTSYDPESRVLTIDWRLVSPQSPEAGPLATTRYLMRQYFPDDVERLLATRGLTIRARYGDFDGSPFDADAKRQIVLCARAG